MLDPLSAIGLASAIVQFIDFSGSLISETREIYGAGKGSLKQHEELAAITQDLKSLCQNLTPPQTKQTPSHSEDELALQEISKTCKDVAGEILLVLEKLKAKGKYEKFESFKTALKSALKREKIEEIKARIDRAQAQLQLRLIALIKEQQSHLTLSIEVLLGRGDKLETLVAQELARLHVQHQTAIAQQRKEQDAASALLHDMSSKLIELQMVCEANKVSQSVRVLESLAYKSIHARQSAVSEEHAETFRWILRRGQSPGFLEWLEASGGIYWVAGKAGSGKSTLMKFVSQHSATRFALRQWSGNRKLVVASHYFWNSGGDIMQTSQIGLLRSLLFQILRQCPEFISNVCQPDSSVDYSDSYAQWTLKRLVAAFARLCEEDLSSVRICVFIDGLDEYVGDHQDIVDLFLKFSASSNLKLCLSSRPWNIFSNAFGTDTTPKLRLEDLTRQDIRTFVTDKLGKDYRFQSLSNVDPRYRDLIEEVVDRAQGVFLWVALVVRSLLNGLIDDNSISDMQRRLSFFPSDLDNFFQHMMDGIEEVYKPQAAKIFQMVTAARAPLPVYILKYLETEEKDADYAVKLKHKQISEKGLARTRGKLGKYLNARCKGLLEIQMYDGLLDIRLDEDNPPVFCHTIEFLHRTVRDFLVTPKLDARLQAEVPKGFEVNTTLCRAHLALLKEYEPDNPTDDDLNDDCANGLSNEVLYYARRVELEYDRCEWATLEALEAYHARGVFAYPNLSSMSTRTRRLEDFEDWEEVVWEKSQASAVLRWAVHAGLAIYVERKLDHLDWQTNDGSFPLLMYALQSPMLDIPCKLDLHPTMIQLLLSRGADPNEKINSRNFRNSLDADATTVWSTFVKSVESMLREVNMSEESSNLIVQSMALLLNAGADFRCLCPRGLESGGGYKKGSPRQFGLGYPWNKLKNCALYSGISIYFSLK